jgi:diacylglycerol kinase
MICCTLIAGLLALLMWPLAALRGKPLAWRLETAGSHAASPLNSRPRLQSFGHAFAGIKFAAQHERNMRFHLLAAMLAVGLGIWFRIDAADWRWLMLAIGLVIATEALNTAVEQCCNAVTREFSAPIKAAKDTAAGAVLICSICAALIGASIFMPYILQHNPTAPLCGHL